jgi:hypothetical protein
MDKMSDVKDTLVVDEGADELEFVPLDLNLDKKDGDRALMIAMHPCN